jgi:hypothetical protein
LRAKKGKGAQRALSQAAALRYYRFIAIRPLPLRSESRQAEVSLNLSGAHGEDEWLTLKLAGGAGVVRQASYVFAFGVILLGPVTVAPK